MKLSELIKNLQALANEGHDISNVLVAYSTSDGIRYNKEITEVTLVEPEDRPNYSWIELS